MALERGTVAVAIGSAPSSELSLARKLARRSLAVAVVAKARICLLDFLSSAFEARNHDWSRQAIGIARELEWRNHHWDSYRLLAMRHSPLRRLAQPSSPLLPKPAQALLAQELVPLGKHKSESS